MIGELHSIAREAENRRGFAMALCLIVFSMCFGCSSSPEEHGVDSGVDFPRGDSGSDPVTCGADEIEVGRVCLPDAVYVRGASLSASAWFTSWTGDGSPNDPVASVHDAIAVAIETNKHTIVLCNRYTDDVHTPFSPQHVINISSIDHAIEIRGDYSCGMSGYGGEWARNQMQAEASIWIENASQSMVIRDVKSGTSAVAATIIESPEVILADVALSALVSNEDTPLWHTHDYKDIPVATGNYGFTVKCPAGDSSTGGSGGTSYHPAGWDGTPDRGGVGKDGGVGPDGDNGLGATIVGRIVNGRWRGEPGQYGENGGVGGGGRGGDYYNSSYGYAGASGGCGGAGGTAGKPGGSSIGLISVNSGVTLEGGSIRTADATHGGQGFTGQIGQDGGSRHAPGVSSILVGGYGGKGGDGGSGGGGAGGISVGILYVGTAPTVDSTSITTGAAGHGGPGGIPLSNDGVAGVAAPMLELPAPLAPLCGGMPASCAETTDLAICDTVPGCSADASCRTRPGETGSCNFATKATCEGYAYCVWGACNGSTGLDCAALPAARCSSVPGCAPIP